MLIDSHRVSPTQFLSRGDIVHSSDDILVLLLRVLLVPQDLKDHSERKESKAREETKDHKETEETPVFQEISGDLDHQDQLALKGTG